MPNWIWDASGVKAEVYNTLKGHLAESRLKVIVAMLKLGGAVTDEEIHEQSGLKLSSVNGRRNDLQKLGIVYSFNFVKNLAAVMCLIPFGILILVNYMKFIILLIKN